MQLIALTRTNARRWEPKRLRLRLFTIAAALTRHSRKAVLTLNQKQPWASLAHQAVTALRALPAPGYAGRPNHPRPHEDPGPWTGPRHCRVLAGQE